MLKEERDSQEPVNHKLKYEKPAVVYMEKIEARANVCGGAGSKMGGQPTCNQLINS